SRARTDSAGTAGADCDARRARRVFTPRIFLSKRLEIRCFHRDRAGTFALQPVRKRRSITVLVHCIPEHRESESLLRGVSLDQWCAGGRNRMATAILNRTAAKGGSFLLESPAPADVFTPADLTDDQKLIGQTAEEFVVKEVLPLVKDLEN